MVRQRSIERFYHKEENILCFNDACLGMILVLEGSIRVSLTSAQGRDITLFYIEAGESCILSASCIVGELPLDISFCTSNETKVLAVHAACLQQLIEQTYLSVALLLNFRPNDYLQSYGSCSKSFFCILMSEWRGIFFLFMKRQEKERSR